MAQPPWGASFAAWRAGAAALAFAALVALPAAGDHAPHHSRHSAQRANNTAEGSAAEKHTPHHVQGHSQQRVGERAERRAKDESEKLSATGDHVPHHSHHSHSKSPQTDSVADGRTAEKHSPHHTQRRSQLREGRHAERRAEQKSQKVAEATAKHAPHHDQPHGQSRAQQRAKRGAGDSEDRSRGTQQEKPAERRASLWLTTPDPMYRMAKQPDVFFGEAKQGSNVSNGFPTVNIFQHTGQSIVGFGGAFTDAVAGLFNRLDSEQQDRILEAYFGETGIGYTLGKVPINSNDFSSEQYSFDDTPHDKALRHFDDSVAHDAKRIIPMILRAKEMLAARQEQLRLLVTPWSPPAWMKTNGDMDGSSEKCLRDGMGDAWASYISRWISAYVAKGAPVWAATPQNEPTYASPWEACTFSAEEEASFIADHLGPKLRQEHPDVKLFAFDDNKAWMEDWANATLNNSESAKYLSGIAFHWFSGDQFDLVEKMHLQYPEALLLSTGATYAMAEDGRRGTADFFAVGDWQRGQGYAHDIIGDLNAGTSGWFDWNLVLDSEGGPNRKDDWCDAAIMAEPRGQVSFHPQYYFIGHFSKFILPGSIHLKTEVLDNWGDGHRDVEGYGTCSGDDGLQATAARRPDQKVALVVLNCGHLPGGYNIVLGSSMATLEIPPRAIHTLLFHEREVAGDWSIVAPVRRALHDEALGGGQPWVQRGLGAGTVTASVGILALVAVTASAALLWGRPTGALLEPIWQNCDPSRVPLNLESPGERDLMNADTMPLAEAETTGSVASVAEDGMHPQ